MFSIVEMVVVLVAAALMTVVGIKEDAAKRRLQVLTAEGQNEAVINAALGNWVTNNYATLTQNGPVDVVPPTDLPTLNQLFTQGNLQQPHANGPFWGGTYVISMSVGPSTCSVGTGDCHVSYVLYPSSPVTRGGNPDIIGASIIAQAGGNAFGFSKLPNPGTVTGLNGSWNATNPLPGSPAAAVLATNGPSSDGNSVYIRRDGALTWTGDQNVNGVSLHNVKNLDATGTISTGALTVSGTSSLGTATANTLNTTGNTTVGGTLTVARTIQAGAIGVPRASCSPLGAQASNSDGRGQQLSCQNLNNGAGPIWMPVGGPTQAYNFYQVVNGSVVPAPSCFAGGSPQIRLVPQTFRVDTTAAVNFVGPGSGPWTISITNGSGSATSNVDGGAIGAGEVETYCSY
ncbi:hypothetical protein ACT2FY_01345 [Paraburkholderia fungorum]|uniref:hypothetical protein n=1 Tax=Paraburkholderia fungorum TaxID=134537 RepID=UPI00402B266A